jgi:hypothetical protein
MKKATAVSRSAAASITSRLIRGESRGSNSIVLGSEIAVQVLRIAVARRIAMLRVKKTSGHEPAAV